MTPQERQLVAELFDRLAKLEGQPRDADAERAISEGFARAPNATYPLVQTVLVQDEALKRANARIEEFEALAQGGQQQAPGGGFLDAMRNAFSGREAPRGSVPSVRASGGMGTSGVWNAGARPDPGGGTRAASEPAYAPPPPQYAPPPPQYAPPPPAALGAGAGSFLGTAAASAAGMIGGAMLLNGIRSMFAPSSLPGSSAFDPGLTRGSPSPWAGNAADSDLARDAGLSDIGSGGTAASDADSQHAGLLDSDNGADSTDDSDDGTDGDSDGGFDDGGFDGGDSDTV